jgi:hypothetical protein
VLVLTFHRDMLKAAFRHIKLAPLRRPLTFTRTLSHPVVLSLQQSFAIWVGTRIAFAILTYFAIVYGSQYSTHGLQRAWLLQGGITHLSQFLLAWQQWDAGWYASIVLHSYTRQSTAFYPLYPLLTRVVTSALSLTPVSPRLSVPLAAMLVSNLSALVAFLAIAALAVYETGMPRIALLTLVFTISFPYAFFLTAPYTESTFLATAAIALLCARRGHWTLAATAAYLATLCRSTGMILAAPLLWEYVQQHDWLSWRAWANRWWSSIERWRQLIGATLIAMAAPSAIATYMSYLWWRFHDPLVFISALKSPEWGRQTMAPWHTVSLYIARLAMQPRYGFWWSEMLLEGLLILTFIAIMVVTARTLPISFSLYMAGLLLLVIMTPTTRYDPLLSSGRYLMASLPVFFALARLLHRRPAIVWCIALTATMLQSGFTTLWLTGAWVA